MQSEIVVRFDNVLIALIFFLSRWLYVISYGFFCSHW